MSHPRTPEQQVRRRLLYRGKQPPCAFRTRAGAPCRSFAIGTDGGCLMHSQDEALLERRRAISVAGGQGHSHLARASKLLMAGPLAPLAVFLVKAMEETYLGGLDPLRMSAIAQGVRSLVVMKDLDAGLRVLAKLEAQLEALESGADDGRAETWVGSSEIVDDVPLLEGGPDSRSAGEEADR